MTKTQIATGYKDGKRRVPSFENRSVLRDFPGGDKWHVAKQDAKILSRQQVHHAEAQRRRLPLGGILVDDDLDGLGGYLDLFSRLP